MLFLDNGHDGTFFHLLVMLQMGMLPVLEIEVPLLVENIRLRSKRNDCIWRQ